MLNELAISNLFMDEMIRHVIACLPEEACGLIGGKQLKTNVIIPIENTLHSPVRFRMDELKLLEALNQLEKMRMDLIGTFHSHPKGPPYPSHTDIEELQMLGLIHLICVPDSDSIKIERGQWTLLGFQIDSQGYMQIPIKVG